MPDSQVSSAAQRIDSVLSVDEHSQLPRALGDGAAALRERIGRWLAP